MSQIIQSKNNRKGIFNLDSDTIALWRFEEAGGTVCKDEKNNVNGINNNITFNQAGVLPSTKGYEFIKANSSYVNITAGRAAIEGRSVGSYEIIFKSPPTTLNSCLFSILQNNNKEDYILIYLGGVSQPTIRFANKSDEIYLLQVNILKGDNFYNDNQWHYFVYNSAIGDGNKIYIDGEQIPLIELSYDYGNSNTNAFSVVDANNAAYIGAFKRSDVSRYFDGIIDEMRISSIARSQSEIQANWNKIKNFV